MRHSQSLAVLLCVAALVGCDSAISGPETPVAPQAGLLHHDIDDLLDLDDLPDIHDLLKEYPDAKAIVVGKVDLEAVIDPGVQVQEYRFYVVRHHDLSLQGRFKMHYSDARGGVADVVGDGRCLNFAGPVVELGGIITQVSDGTNVRGIERGTTLVWKVQDNGEGSGAPPDLGSAMAIGSLPASAFPATFCREANLALFPQDNGNIQVARR